MKNRANYPIRRVFIIDEIAIAVSMAIALLVRYREKVLGWHTFFEGLYISIIITFCLFHIIIYLLYDNRKPSIFVQDPFENLMTVIKSRCILMMLSLIYLYAIQRSVDASRFVMGLFFTLSVILGYGLRMLYRKHHLNKFGVVGHTKTLKLSSPFPNNQEINTLFHVGGYDDMLITTTGATEEDIAKVLGEAEKSGIRTYIGLNNLNYEVRSGIVVDVDKHASIPAFVRKDKFELFGVKYSISRTEEAVFHVIRHLKELSGKYICFSNVHTCVMAKESKEYADVLNGAAFTFPDGTPISKLQRKRGLIGADRVAGPDFMEHMFRDTLDGSVTHYFYGSKQETLDALKENLEIKYPGIVIKGLYSPPFRELSDEEDQAVVDMINAADADIIWIGLGAPKQEKWMKAHEGRIHGVMMGVGAGFDFHAGTIKRAPIWIQKVGLEWLYRLFQDPERLLKRYLITNIKFVWYLAVEMIKNGL